MKTKNNSADGNNLEWKKSVKLPLYFGFELELFFNRFKNFKNQIVGPFKTYKGYLATVILLLVIVSGFLFFSQNPQSTAATYNWLQTDWSGGASSATGTHPLDLTGWNTYASADPSLTFGSDVTLAVSSSNITQTNDTDFNLGTHSSTETSGSGDSALVRLAQQAGGTNYADTSNAVAVTLSGNYAYVADGGDGLRIVDISNPASPSVVGTLDTNYAVDVAVYGNYAYVADLLNDTKVVDISNKNAPSLVRTIAGSGQIDTTVYVSGTTLYLGSSTSVSECCTSGYLQSYSLASPDNPSLLDSIDGFAVSKRMFKADNLLYIAQADIEGCAPDYCSKLAIYNVADPSNLLNYQTIEVSITSAEGGYDVAVSGSYAYVADGTSGIRVLYENPTTHLYSLVATYNTPGTAKGIVTASNFAYVADSTNVLKLNISNPLSISQVTTYATTAASVHLETNGTYFYVAASASGLAVIGETGYAASGTFTSSIIDTGANLGYGTISWASTTPATGTLTVKARTSANADMSGATAFASCSALTNGQDLSGGCVTDGQRYVQYEASLATSDSAATPSLNDLTVGYNLYPASQTFISSSYNSGSSSNIVGNLLWAETLPAGTDLKFQISTAPASGNSPGTWSDWLGPTSNADYYTDPTGEETINSTHTSGNNDQWIRYKVFLESTTGLATPSLTEVTFRYVVNAAPEFEAAPIASQSADGSVAISYSVRDSDTATGSVTPGFVTPSFEYSIDSGAWTPITSGLSAGATSTKAVDDVDYTQYNLTWTAKSQIDGSYSTDFKIRVTVNDGEGANNLAQSASAGFAFDVKNPVFGGPAISVNATSSPAALNLSASDDNALEMQLSLNSDFSGASWQAYAGSATISLATDPDTVYARFRDAFGNTTTGQSAVTPETPTYMIVRDVSNIDSSSYQLFVSWKAVATPLLDFRAYYVWSSTDGSNYSLLETIEDRATNFILHEDLSTDTTYYYKVSVSDVNGNGSYYSAAVSDQPNGQGGTDTTPPTISNVSASSITTQSAVITWETDELSNSTVGYSLTPANFATQSGSATMVNNAAGVGAHTIVLTDLIPGTTYYYQVTSEDPLGNGNSDNDGGDGYSFATLAGPVISNVTVTEVLNNQATVSWLTDQAADSTVYYSLNSNLTGATQINTADEVTEHSVTLTNLTLGTTYYYYVASGVASDNNSGEYYSFVTTQDGTAPLITAINVDLLTDSEAVITWLTNERSTSKVFYGLATGVYASSTEDLELNVSHSIMLQNLTPETDYYYVVVSRDGANNTATSTEDNFTTLAEGFTQEDIDEAEDSGRSSAGGGGSSYIVDATPPRLVEIEVKNIGPSSAKVVWKTNESANSFVQFGPTEEYLEIHANWEFATSHEVQMDNMKPGTLYHYRVLSQDKSGNLTQADDATFTTAPSDGTEALADEELPPAETEDPNISLTSMVNETSDFITKIAGQVSTSVLESSLSLQHDLIEKLSGTLPRPLFAGEPRVSVTDTTAQISWTTDKKANSLVAYADQNQFNPGSENPYAQVVGNAEEMDVKHTVLVSSLSPDTLYHFQLQSKTAVSQLAKSSDFTFRTNRRALEVSSYVIDKKKDDQVIFRWITNLDSDSSLKYIPYRDNQKLLEQAKTVQADEATTIHQLEVTDFEPGVVYEIEMSSIDAGGNVASKVIDAYSTNEENLPPIISQVQTDAAISPGKEVKIQTIISWTTNEPATSRIYFQKGLTSSEEQNLANSTPLDHNYTKKHVTVITTLEPGIVYQFRVESTDLTGQTTISKKYTILTPRPKETVFQIIISNIEQTFGWLNKLKK